MISSTASFSFEDIPDMLEQINSHLKNQYYKPLRNDIHYLGVETYLLKDFDSNKVL